MDAYCAVISLHNLGYQLKALDGDQIAIRPSAAKEHAELIMALRKEPQKACRAIQHLPHLCAVIIPQQNWIRQYAVGIFKALQETGYGRIVAIRFSRATKETEWVYVPLHAVGYHALQDIIENKWGDYYECQEEGQRWGT